MKLTHEIMCCIIYFIILCGVQKGFYQIPGYASFVTLSGVQLRTFMRLGSSLWSEQLDSPKRDSNLLYGETPSNTRDTWNNF